MDLALVEFCAWGPAPLLAATEFINRAETNTQMLNKINFTSMVSFFPKFPACKPRKARSILPRQRRFVRDEGHNPDAMAREPRT